MLANIWDCNFHYCMVIGCCQQNSSRCVWMSVVWYVACNSSDIWLLFRIYLLLQMRVMPKLFPYPTYCNIEAEVYNWSMSAEWWYWTALPKMRQLFGNSNKFHSMSCRVPFSRKSGQSSFPFNWNKKHRPSKKQLKTSFLTIK